MTEHAGTESPTEMPLHSPLDPFLGLFLRRVGEYREGYAPTSHGVAVAAAFDWPPAFAEALFTSARVRGLVEPHRARGSRARNRWCVSARGTRWLEVAAPSTDPQPVAG